MKHKGFHGWSFLFPQGPSKEWSEPMERNQQLGCQPTPTAKDAPSPFGGRVRPLFAVRKLPCKSAFGIPVPVLFVNKELPMSFATLTPARTRRPSLRQTTRPRLSVNVGDKERLLSFLGGSALGLYGLSRFSWGGLALAAVGGSLIYRGMSGHCSLYQALDVSTATPRGPATSIRAGHGVKVEESTIVGRDAATLWHFWRKLENLGRFMQHLERVEELDERRSRWVACGPLGYPITWEAEIINEKENELIAWRSVDDSNVDTAGSVHFRELPHGRGTEVRVVLKYDAHAAQLAAPLARIMGQSPQQQIHEDLRRFKQVMESGETATTESQPRGQCG
jgi:uncharacterized membrane protein